MLMTLYLYKDHETSALSTVSTTGDVEAYLLHDLSRAMIKRSRYQAERLSISLEGPKGKVRLKAYGGKQSPCQHGADCVHSTTRGDGVNT